MRPLNQQEKEMVRFAALRGFETIIGILLVLSALWISTVMRAAQKKVPFEPQIEQTVNQDDGYVEGLAKTR